MGELILCRQPMAATPFYIENASLNIYSLEELCYYIYHNTETLDPMLISDELLDWIDQELSFTALSERLRTQKRSGMPFHVQIETILSSCGYLTPAEIRDTVHDIMLFIIPTHVFPVHHSPWIPFYADSFSTFRQFFKSKNHQVTIVLFSSFYCFFYRIRFNYVIGIRKIPPSSRRLSDSHISGRT